MASSLVGKLMHTHEAHDLEETPTDSSELLGLEESTPINPKHQRIIRRTRDQSHSTGQWNVKRKGGSNLQAKFLDDPFHTLINFSSSKVIALLFAAFLLLNYAFAAAYYALGSHCNLNIQTMVEAWMFSLETTMTTGYGAPGNDVFFNNCSAVASIITVQSFCSLLMEGLVVGVFFARISRAQTRACTITFSRNAVIRRIRDHWYLIFQICERRKHQLVEGHVRCYAVRHERCPRTGRTIPYLTHNMRLSQPNDELNAPLFLALPSFVIHRIDPWSPLYPPRVSADVHDASSEYLFPDVLLREVDSEQGVRTSRTPQEPLTASRLQQHLADSKLEVVVFVEGVDAPTSATVQARHSYKADEIRFEHMFKQSVYQTKRGAVVCFDCFQELEHCDDSSKIISGSACPHLHEV